MHGDKITFFRNLKDTDRESIQHFCCSCIPACTRNLLKYYGIRKQNGDYWNEMDVIEHFNKMVPSENWKCKNPECGLSLNQAPTFRITKELEQYPTFGNQYKVKISPDEDGEEIKKRALVLEAQLRAYILKNLFEIVVGDSPKPVLVSLFMPYIYGIKIHTCIVVEINDREVSLFDPVEGFKIISRNLFDSWLCLTEKGDHSTICYICNKSS